MHTKKHFLALLLAISCFSAAYSQSTYKSAIGLRAGYPIAVTYKQFITDQGAIEAFAGHAGYTGYGFFELGACYEHHFPIGSIEGFQWFVGGGLGVNLWHFNSAYYNSDLYSSTSFSIMAVGGVDYKFAKIPLNVSADIMPAFYLGGDLVYSSSFRAGYGALSARYTFK